MRLKLTRDTGDLIVGEMISEEDETAVSPLIVAVAGAQQVTIESMVRSSKGKKSGERRSRTVVRVDESVFPGLKQAEDLEIREANSGTVLYRRFKSAGTLEAKVFWFNLSPMPDESLEGKVKQHFSDVHPAVERLSRPELTALITDASSRSIFLTGRPPLRPLLNLLQANNFHIVTLLRDPYEELAERILFMNLIFEKKALAEYSERLTELRPLLTLAKKIDVRDPASSVPVFENLKRAQRRALANPLIIALSCNPDEIPAKRHIGMALENLAKMDLVGLRTRFDDFKTSLAELLGADILSDYQPAQIVDETAAQLKKIPQFVDLISLDLELFAHASEAVEEALSTISTELDPEQSAG